jgi:hypothetical protein
MSNPTTPLIELRHHYQDIIAQAEYQVTQAKSQIEHIDALLVNGLLQAQEPTVLKAGVILDMPALAAASLTDFDSDAQTSQSANGLSEPKASATKARTTKAKAQAAAKTKTATKTQAAKTATSSGRESFPLLPAYQGMTKLEAIGQILSEQSGHVLHQDTIIQLLYGDLSPEVLKVESRRMRASLFQGVTKGLWQRAPKQPSSYIGKSGKARKSKTAESEDTKTKEGAKTAKIVQSKNASTPPTARAGKKSRTATATKAVVAKKSSSRGREQVLSLPAEYAGLSKIDTVAKVLDENKGKVMHMDDIIEQLYGKLSGNELKAEKVRMKDVMTRGVKRKLWQKAEGVPSSIIAGPQSQSSTTSAKSSASAAGTSPSKRPGRKPKSSSSSPVKESKSKTTPQRRRRSSARG